TRHPGHYTVASTGLPEGLAHHPHGPLPNLRRVPALAWMASLSGVRCGHVTPLFPTEGVSIEPRAVHPLVGAVDPGFSAGGPSIRGGPRRRRGNSPGAGTRVGMPSASPDRSVGASGACTTGS